MPSLDISFGGRLQRNMVNAQDTYDPTMDPNAGFYSIDPQAPPVDTSEWQYAAHVGYEYRANSVLTFFGRAARAFRAAQCGRTRGVGSAFSLVTPPNFDLKTQTSYDVEDGFRVKWGRFEFREQRLLDGAQQRDPFHSGAVSGHQSRPDPAARLGEQRNAISLTDDVRLHGGVAYTRATFRDGPFAGNDIPLVSRWTGNAGASWDIWKKLAVSRCHRAFRGRAPHGQRPDQHPAAHPGECHGRCEARRRNTIAFSGRLRFRISSTSAISTTPSRAPSRRDSTVPIRNRAGHSCCGPARPFDQMTEVLLI